LSDEYFRVPIFRQVIGGKVYADDNNDRFVMSIRLNKHIEMKLGPGEYFIDGDKKVIIISIFYFDTLLSRKPRSFA
jgi:hypothetical protein